MANKIWLSTTVVCLTLSFSAVSRATTAPKSTKTDDRYQAGQTAAINRDQTTTDDPGKSSKDVALSQSIRRQILNQDSLSLNAKNIKIRTVDGVVTLKGLVESPGEKEIVENIARTTAGQASVVSHLDVQSKNL